MKITIKNECPHCGCEIPLSSIRYEVISSTPIRDARYVCSNCRQTLRPYVLDCEAERRVSFVSADEKHEAVWSITFPNLNRPVNPFVVNTTLEVDFDRFMSELTLGSTEHVDALGNLYIDQSLNQGHLTTNGVICVEGDEVNEALIAAYRPHLVLPARYFPDVNLAASFATNLAWLFKYTVHQATSGVLLQKTENEKIIWSHILQSAVVIDYLLRNRWIAQLFNYWYQYVFDYDVEPILYSADGSVWLSKGFVEGLETDGPLFLYRAGYRELSFEEAIEIVMQDDPVKHHEENSHRFSPDRETTNLNPYGSVTVPTDRVLH